VIYLMTLSYVNICSVVWLQGKDLDMAMLH
jgi:hypothetical protein